MVVDEPQDGPSEPMVIDEPPLEESSQEQNLLEIPSNILGEPALEIEIGTRTLSNIR